MADTYFSKGRSCAVRKVRAELLRPRFEHWNIRLRIYCYRTSAGVNNTVCFETEISKNATFEELQKNMEILKNFFGVDKSNAIKTVDVYVKLEKRYSNGMPYLVDIRKTKRANSAKLELCFKKGFTGVMDFTRENIRSDFNTMLDEQYQIELLGHTAEEGVV